MKYRHLAYTAIVLSLSATHAEAGGVKIGILTCHESSGWGFIFGSTKNLRCHFSNGSGYVEHYEGTVEKFGVDIGYTSSAVIIWDVVAPNQGMAKGALAGGYAGAHASIAVWGGGGANVLVGGLDRSITLQPVSIEGETGLNVAAGISAISLKFVRADGRAAEPED